MNTRLVTEEINAAAATLFTNILIPHHELIAFMHCSFFHGRTEELEIKKGGGGSEVLKSKDKKNKEPNNTIEQKAA